MLLTLGVLLLAAPDAIPALIIPGAEPMSEMAPMSSKSERDCVERCVEPSTALQRSTETEPATGGTRMGDESFSVLVDVFAP